MQQDYDSSASGYLTDAYEGISQVFTDVEILSISEVNVVAKAKRYGRWWLLKGLRKDVANEMGYQQRLRKELEILMQLQHPGVVMAVGLEDVEALGLCIVMEYVDGVTLKGWLQNKTNRQQRRHVSMALCETVSYIHSKGIVHRDLKPENIMITQNGGNVKLIDFGLADTDSHTILKQPAGTQRYMSPEQAQTTVADVRNDIYSIGVIFSQMDLGYSYRHIIKRCENPIDRRYQDIEDLMNDMRKSTLTIRRLLIVCLALFLVGVAVWTGVQRLEMQNVHSRMNTSEERQDTMKKTIEQLNDSLEKVTAAHQLLKDKQEHQAAERVRVENAIAQGKMEIDRAMKNAGIKQHLDTLSNFAYLRHDFLYRFNDGVMASKQYLDRIHKDFTESEMAEITYALTFYYSMLQENLLKRYNTMKEAYDSQFMQ